jgi:hypothetical protein
MTVMQAFLLGIMVVLTPSLICVAWLFLTAAASDNL